MKPPFLFEYTRPCLDWYEIEKVELKWDDYCYLRLERRFGPSWWLVGKNPVEKPNYHWENKDIGEIYELDIKRLIEWAKNDGGSKITEVSAICGDFDIVSLIKSL